MDRIAPWNGLGAFAEWATGMGILRFGDVPPTPATFPMLIGGAYRSWWEERRMKPIVDSVREKEGALQRRRRAHRCFCSA